MKLPHFTVIALAITSSLATVGVIELLRTPEQSPILAQTPTPPENLNSDVSTAPCARDFSELERRIQNLEQNQVSRQPIAPEAADNTAAPVLTDDLRTTVLSWVAEDREATRRAKEIEDAEKYLEKMVFESRYQAHLLAVEHDLPDWEELKLQRLFLETELRRDEVGKEINSLSLDPEEIERRWLAFDEWGDQRYQEELGQELNELLFGDD